MTRESSGDPQKEEYGNRDIGSDSERSNIRTATGSNGADFGHRGRSCFAEDSGAAFLLGRV